MEQMFLALAVMWFPGRAPVYPCSRIHPVRSSRLKTPQPLRNPTSRFRTLSRCSRGDALGLRYALMFGPTNRHGTCWRIAGSFERNIHLWCCNALGKGAPTCTTPMLSCPDCGVINQVLVTMHLNSGLSHTNRKRLLCGTT